MAGRLHGKVAVVTGGASGIGRACALRFAEQGADVLIADLNPQRGAQVVAEVEAMGRRARFVETDTSSEEASEAMADAALDHFGRIDVGLAAAGISHAAYVSRVDPKVRPGSSAFDWEAGAIINKSLRSWEKVLAVNLTGVMITDRVIARRMIDQGVRGSIVNISSTAALLPFPGIGDYSVSKAGVWMLTKVLARELAQHGVRVNAVGPGLVETPMSAPLMADDRVLRRTMDATPMKRAAKPEEVADAALFLACDESSYVTGEILFVDGGMFTG